MSLNPCCKGSELGTGSSQQAKPAIAPQSPESGQAAPGVPELWEATGVLAVAEKGSKLRG